LACSCATARGTSCSWRPARGAKLGREAEAQLSASTGPPAAFLEELRVAGGPAPTSHAGDQHASALRPRRWQHLPRWRAARAHVPAGVICLPAPGWGSTPLAPNRAAPGRPYLADGLRAPRGDGKLELIDRGRGDLPGVRLDRNPGATPAERRRCASATAGNTVFFSSDFMPDRHHLPLPWIPGQEPLPARVARGEERSSCRAPSRRSGSSDSRTTSALWPHRPGRKGSTVFTEVE